MRVLVKRPTVKKTSSDLPHLNRVVLNPLTASSELRDGLPYAVKKMSLSDLDEFILEIEKFKRP